MDLILEVFSHSMTLLVSGWVLYPIVPIVQTRVEEQARRGVV
jgi:hypothetical protein